MANENDPLGFSNLTVADSGKEVHNISVNDPLTLSPRTKDLNTLDEDELSSVREVPNVDVDKFRKAGKIERLGRGVLSNFLEMTSGTLGTSAFVAGKSSERFALKDPEGKVIGSPDSFVAEKIRDFGLALSQKTEEWKKNVQGGMAPAESYGEKWVEGLSSTPGSMAGMLGMGLLTGGIAAGGALLVGASAPMVAGIATVGGVLGRFGASKAMNYKSLYDPLIEAGYSFEKADEIADFWSLPLGALDFTGLEFATQTLVKPFRKAVLDGFTKDNLLKMGIESVVKSQLAEGVTETVQGAIQDAVLMRYNALNQDFWQYLENRSIDFSVGALSGGAANGIGVGMQLRARNNMVEHIVKNLKVPRSDAAELVNNHILKLNELTYETLSRHIDIEDSMKSINDEFVNLTQKETPEAQAPTLERAKPVTEIPGIQEILLEPGPAGKETAKKLDVFVEGQTQNISKLLTEQNELLTKTEPTEVEKARLEELDVQIEDNLRSIDYTATLSDQMRSGKINPLGKVTVKSAEIYREKLKTLKRVFEATKRWDETRAKDVKTALLGVISNSGLSKDKYRGLLRRVMAINPKNYDTKIGSLVQTINDVMAQDKVKSWKALGRKMIDQIASDKSLPQDQHLGEHLKRVLNGDHPGNKYDSMSSDPEEIYRAVREQAAYDLATSDSLAVNKSAVKSLSILLKDSTQMYADWKASKEATKELLVGKVINQLAKAKVKGLNMFAKLLDFHRQKERTQAIVRPGLFAQFDVSLKAVLDLIDGADTSTKQGQGPVFQALNNDNADMAHMVGLQRAKGFIDVKLEEIYGKKFGKILAKYLQENFVEVDGFAEDGTATTAQVTRDAAMGMWMLLNMPDTRERFIESNRLNTEWVKKFEAQEVGQFSPQDMQWLGHVRETFDKYYELIAPVYEKLTGKPLNAVQKYYVVRRYLMDGADVDTEKILQDIMSGQWDNTRPEDDSTFRGRTKVTYPYKNIGLFHTLNQYAASMEHFLAYAGYVEKLRMVFTDPRVRDEVSSKLGDGYLSIVDEFSDRYGGKRFDGVDRKISRRFFTLLGLYARNLLAPPKQALRQFTGLASFTDIEGIGALELSQAAADIPRAFKSGEMDGFLKNAYMKQRFAGGFDIMARYIEEQARIGIGSDIKGKGPVTAIKQLALSKRLHDIVTVAAKVGDGASSIIGGWAVYKKEIAAGKTPEQAALAASLAVNGTQQSMFLGDYGVAYGRTDIASRLFTLFTRSTMLYWNRYMQVMKAALPNGITNVGGDLKALAEGKSRTDMKQVTRTILTYHLWVPLFEMLLTAGVPDDEEDWKLLGLYSALGPFSYHVMIGQALQAIAATAFQHMNPDTDMPKYLAEVANQNMVTKVYSDTQQAVKKSLDFFEYPDYETMWPSVKALSKVGDVILPTSYAAKFAEGSYLMLQQNPEDMWTGLFMQAGFSETQAKRLSNQE